MKIVVVGSVDDLQCQAIRRLFEQKNIPVVAMDCWDINDGAEWSYLGDRFIYRGQSLHDVGAVYLRHIMSPYPPTFQLDGEHHLFKDWFVEYMHRRERFGMQLSFLLAMSAAGIPVVNPPEHGSVVQMKPYQLDAARRAGLNIPATLITNSPERLKEFISVVKEVVYKPSMGGGLCRALSGDDELRLDVLCQAPVTFQERIRGDSIRVTMVGPEVVSSVKIPTDELDYRNDKDFAEGRKTYDLVGVPDDVVAGCRTLMKECGLIFSGIDFIRREDGSYVFLEANSSPVYLDVERKTQTPISERLVQHILRLASDPRAYRNVVAGASAARSFAAYALPIDPERSVGG